MNILFLGDIVGRPGREAVKKILPELKNRFDADLIIANGENLAHGKGVTKNSAEEMRKAGIDLLTSGNHIWRKKDMFSLAEEKDPFVLRPANYPEGVPGKGWKILQAGAYNVLIVNLIGRVFMREDFDCPFRKFDEILKETERFSPDAIIVDFHAEATSEKRGFGFYADGKAAAVLGTHTHIQTSDEQILPKGTAYITDLGMAGALDSILGVKKEDALNNFLFQTSQPMEVADLNQIEICGAILKFEGKKVKSIERIREVVDINN